MADQSPTLSQEILSLINRSTEVYSQTLETQAAGVAAGADCTVALRDMIADAIDYDKQDEVEESQHSAVVANGQNEAPLNTLQPSEHAEPLNDSPERDNALSIVTQPASQPVPEVESLPTPGSVDADECGDGASTLVSKESRRSARLAAEAPCDVGKAFDFSKLSATTDAPQPPPPMKETTTDESSKNTKRYKATSKGKAVVSMSQQKVAPMKIRIKKLEKRQTKPAVTRILHSVLLAPAADVTRPPSSATAANTITLSPITDTDTAHGMLSEAGSSRNVVCSSPLATSTLRDASQPVSVTAVQKQPIPGEDIDLLAESETTTKRFVEYSESKRVKGMFIGITEAGLTTMLFPDHRGGNLAVPDRTLKEAVKVSQRKMAQCSDSVAKAAMLGRGINGYARTVMEYFESGLKEPIEFSKKLVRSGPKARSVEDYLLLQPEPHHTAFALAYVAFGTTLQNHLGDEEKEDRAARLDIMRQAFRHAYCRASQMKSTHNQALEDAAGTSAQAKPKQKRRRRVGMEGHLQTKKLAVLDDDSSAEEDD